MYQVLKKNQYLYSLLHSESNKSTEVRIVEGYYSSLTCSSSPSLNMQVASILYFLMYNYKKMLIY